MLTFIKIEFLKLKRSKIFLLSLIGAVLPPLLMFIAVTSFDEGEVLNVSVAKEYRKQGIAYQMLQHLLNEGESKGIKHFTLEVREGNVPARTLYEKLGFNNKYLEMRFNKKTLSKKYGFPLTMTETEMVKELGYDRIWDCGLIKYIWKKPEE